MIMTVEEARFLLAKRERDAESQRAWRDAGRRAAVMQAVAP